MAKVPKAPVKWALFCAKGELFKITKKLYNSMLTFHKRDGIVNIVVAKREKQQAIARNIKVFQKSKNVVDKQKMA
jgi:hypothetical protein